MGNNQKILREIIMSCAVKKKKKKVQFLYFYKNWTFQIRSFYINLIQLLVFQLIQFRSLNLQSFYSLYLILDLQLLSSLLQRYCWVRISQEVVKYQGLLHDHPKYEFLLLGSCSGIKLELLNNNVDLILLFLLVLSL